MIDRSASYSVKPRAVVCCRDYLLVNRPNIGREGCVYLLRNRTNGRGYVGQTLNTESRWWTHINDALAKNSQYPIHRAIRKCGVEGISAEILWTGSEFKLNEKEIEYIVKLKTHVSQGGYNVTWGGDGVRGMKFTAASKRKLVKSLKKFYAEHPEACARVGADHRGTRHTAEHCAKIGAASKGRRHTRGTKLSMSENAAARWADPVYRANQAAAQASRKADPERTAQVSAACAAGARKRYEDPKERAKSARLTRSVWKRPGFKEKTSIAISDGMQDVIKTPEYCKKMSEIANARIAKARERQAALARVT